ncbi:hypothetical protein QR680_013301 [Steinernema hermaphroditum]|uniref:Uncharacterized protein n=1 Tax=Steinernema hermaphroditum TaxID=289476 RepID=A0AA39M2A4_9BILA|nr:hypothetical protein QR680_013301 [Steinernema hermaphroditum]
MGWVMGIKRSTIVYVSMTIHELSPLARCTSKESMLSVARVILFTMLMKLGASKSCFKRLKTGSPKEKIKFEDVVWTKCAQTKAWFFCDYHHIMLN